MNTIFSTCGGKCACTDGGSSLWDYMYYVSGHAKSDGSKGVNY